MVNMNLANGLVGHWTMDDQDTQSETVTDRSAYDNHGGTNGEVITEDSIFGSVISAGEDKTSRVRLSEDIEFTAEATLSIWMKPNSYGTDDHPYAPGICAAGTGSWGDWMTFRDLDGTTTIRIGVSSTDSTIQFNTFDKFFDWKHFVLALSDNGDSVTFDLYIDGEYHDSSSDSDFETFTIGSALVGYAGATNNGLLDGQAYDFRLYDRVLSEDEIKRLYNMRSQNNWNV